MSAMKSTRKLIFLQEAGVTEPSKFCDDARFPSGVSADAGEGPDSTDSCVILGPSPASPSDNSAIYQQKDSFAADLLTPIRRGRKRNARFEDSPLAKRSRHTTLHVIEGDRSIGSSFRKHVSESEVTRAEKANEERNLTGDFSRPCSLPTIHGDHPDILTISPHTLSEILSREDHNVLVVDCRYPYEYEGGYIVGAKNLYTQAKIMEEFIADKQPLTGVTQPRHILVFHCEFSQKRGPGLLRFLRAQDRALNAEGYPALHYPEVYILQGGYKAFWQFCSLHKKDGLCEPNSYRQMADEEFKEELRQYKSYRSRKMQKKDIRCVKTALEF